jgi:tRNA dimethylallyltransferase
MAPRIDHVPLVVILGATGSGKSALGLHLARLFNGEIIAADSRTVYKGMDISTAKPTLPEQRSVRHYLIDVVYPYQTFTVADFKTKAQEAIKEIALRGKAPFLVGGTGLYIDALLYDFTLRPTVISQGERELLSKKTIEELQQYILMKGLSLPKDIQNPRRLVRTIEADGILPERAHLRQNTLVVGISMSRLELKERITHRVNKMVESGLVGELELLSSKYGWGTPALQTPGYKAFRAYLEGSSTLEEAKLAFARNDMNLAKRQQAWFKRNKDVHWVSSQDETVELVTTFLNKY